VTDGVMCRCGYNMKCVGVLVVHDSLNGNIFCDVEFACDECKRRKYIRCPESMVLKAQTQSDYKLCLEKRKILIGLSSFKRD
jgi:hypothetical protein